MGIKYFDLLKKSWHGFKRNPVLLLPIFISLGLFLGFLFVVFLEVLVFVIVFSKSILLDPISVLQSSQGILLIVFFGIADLIFIWMISSYTRAMQIGMYADVAKGKKVTTDVMFGYGKGFFKIYFKYILTRFVIFVLPILVLGVFVYSCYLYSKILAIFVGVLAFLVFLAYMIFVGFGLFFIEPIIVSERKGIIELMKYSFNHMMKNFGHVIATWGVKVLVTIAVVLIMLLIQTPVDVLIEILERVGPSGVLVPLYGLNFIFEIVNIIVNVIMGIVLDLFVFGSYFAKKTRR